MNAARSTANASVLGLRRAFTGTAAERLVGIGAGVFLQPAVRKHGCVIGPRHNLPHTQRCTQPRSQHRHSMLWASLVPHSYVRTAWRVRSFSDPSYQGGEPPVLPTVWLSKQRFGACACPSHDFLCRSS